MKTEGTQTFFPSELSQNSFSGMELIQLAESLSTGSYSIQYLKILRRQILGGC